MAGRAHHCGAPGAVGGVTGWADPGLYELLIGRIRMALDRNGDEWCGWCGGTIPDARTHLETCRNACARALASDERRREREAARTARKAARYRPRPDSGRCPVCGETAPCQSSCVIPEPPSGPVPPKCRACCIRHTDGIHTLCAGCLKDRERRLSRNRARRRKQSNGTTHSHQKGADTNRRPSALGSQAADTRAGRGQHPELAAAKTDGGPIQAAGRQS